MKNLADGKDMPLGLGMGLAKNIYAMNKFANMTKVQQQAIIDQTHSIDSKDEMQKFVQNIADGNTIV